MFNFDMKTSHSYGLFHDQQDDDEIIIVDSWDHRHFEVRHGTTDEKYSSHLITAKSDEELNKQLHDLLNKKNQATQKQVKEGKGLLDSPLPFFATLYGLLRFSPGRRTKFGLYLVL